MKEWAEPTMAERQYAAAYEAHYATKDLRVALLLYKSVLAMHPDSIETGYCRAQIRNIAKSVVPEADLCDAQLDMALSHATTRS
jgi:hypothetical protein